MTSAGRRPAPRPKSSKQATRLARWRIARGLTQEQLAARTGISRATLQRLELGEVRNPPLRTLTNCALALQVPLDQLIDDEWREWFVFDATKAPRPPRRWLPDWQTVADEADVPGTESAQRSNQD